MNKTEEINVSGVPDISQTLPIPKNLVGYIIGRKGHTLAGIMKGSGTKIFIQENEKDPEWQYIHVRGTARSVNRAKKIIVNAIVRASGEKKNDKN